MADNFFCEMNDDELGRPYLGPYDEFTPAYYPVFAAFINLTIGSNQGPTTRPPTQPTSTRFPQCLFTNECFNRGG